MVRIVGEVTGPSGTKRVMLTEALQAALDNAPPSGSVQRFCLVDVELQHGGFIGATVTRVTMDVEDGSWEDKPKSIEPCEASYTAQQIESAVIIIAIGSHPAAGYETRFVEAPIRVYPPEHTLYHLPPSGPTAEVITPFAVCTSFQAEERVSEVIVHDANGEHVIPVEQVSRVRINAPLVPAT